MVGDLDDLARRCGHVVWHHLWAPKSGAQRGARSMPAPTEVAGTVVPAHLWALKSGVQQHAKPRQQHPLQALLFQPTTHLVSASSCPPSPSTPPYNPFSTAQAQTSPSHPHRTHPQQRSLTSRSPQSHSTHLDVCEGIKAIQLVQQLQHGSLDLSLPAAVCVVPLGADGIDLVCRGTTVRWEDEIVELVWIVSSAEASGLRVEQAHSTHSPHHHHTHRLPAAPVVMPSSASRTTPGAPATHASQPLPGSPHGFVRCSAL